MTLVVPGRRGPAATAIRAAFTAYVVLLVAVPLVAMAWTALSDGPGAFVAALKSPVALAALKLTFWTSLLVAVIGLFLGTATAWVLVRYEFPGRALLSSFIDLPLALPTLVAGLMIASLFGPQATLGRALLHHGVRVIFAPPGIVLALLFVTLPFGVRSVEPTLRALDPAEEEAAATLGAGPFATFRRVVLPAIAPAAISGAVRTLARALGEFGSIVVVAGNMPRRTLTAPVYVFAEIESGAPRVAAAVSLVLLLLALALYGATRLIDRRREAAR
jgi:sulfate transport system permease protein